MSSPKKWESFLRGLCESPKSEIKFFSLKILDLNLLKRFPEDFMFQLTRDEFEILKSQFVTSNWGGLRRAYPYAFTEQGIAMLSAVLKSLRAIKVSIEIMRTFVKLRRWLVTHKDLAKRLNQLETKYDRQFKIVFDAIREIMAPPIKNIRKIGFRTEEK